MMPLTNAVAAASLLLALINTVSAVPHPGIIRERHIIRTPIKIKVIHHYRVKKVPIVIKKHLHYYKEEKEEVHHHHHTKPIIEEIDHHPKPHFDTIYHHSKPDLEEHHSNHVYHDADDDEDHGPYEYHPPSHGGRGKFKGSHGSSHHHHSHHEEDEYEEPEQSKEEEYEDNEYE